MKDVLRIIYDDKKSNFGELFIKDNFIFAHHRYIETFAFEMSRFANDMSSGITN